MTITYIYILVIAIAILVFCLYKQSKKISSLENEIEKALNKETKEETK